MRRTIPTLAVTAFALASAAFGAQAAGTMASPAAPATTTTSSSSGNVLGNPNRTTSAPLTVAPGTTLSQTNMESGPFSPAAPNTLSSSVPTSPATATGSSTVTATGPAATNVTTNPASTNANPDPFGPNSTFVNDNGNPELGQSPGQTSSGTLVGNSSPGIGTGTETLGNPGAIGVPVIGANGTAVGSSFVAPVDFTGGGFAYGMGGGGAATPTYSGGTSTTVAIPATTPTPLLNQVTASEINKEARQRAQGREPRVIGIAPRGGVDRTNQMPDDPIIRY